MNPTVAWWRQPPQGLPPYENQWGPYRDCHSVWGAPWPPGRNSRVGAATPNGNQWAWASQKRCESLWGQMGSLPELPHPVGRQPVRIAIPNQHQWRPYGNCNFKWKRMGFPYGLSFLITAKASHTGCRFLWEPARSVQGLQFPIWTAGLPTKAAIPQMGSPYGLPLAMGSPLVRAAIPTEFQRLPPRKEYHVQ